MAQEMFCGVEPAAGEAMRAGAERGLAGEFGGIAEEVEYADHEPAHAPPQLDWRSALNRRGGGVWFWGVSAFGGGRGCHTPAMIRQRQCGRISGGLSRILHL